MATATAQGEGRLDLAQIIGTDWVFVVAESLTFLFTDLENSTYLWEAAPNAMREAMVRHDEIMRAAVEEHNGRLVKKTGDGLIAVFESATDAVHAAIAGQLAMLQSDWPEETGPLRVRMGLHSGEAVERDGDYYGSTVNQAARTMALGHGGQVLSSEATVIMVRDQMPRSITFSDLGVHRLKGFARAEKIYQVNHPEFVGQYPSLESAALPTHNLPTPLTPLVGRESELEAVCGLLLDPNLSLVSIVAPGGTGKSRLALEVGRRMVDRFPDGVYFVELAPISDSRNIIGAVAEAVGYSFQQNGRDQKQQVLDYVGNKCLLLILDNFEHLVEGGADLVAEFLHAAPELKILTTSRQRLFQPGETLFTLHGLRAPDADSTDDAAGYAAVEMFVQSARRAMPAFTLTADNVADVADYSTQAWCHAILGWIDGVGGDYASAEGHLDRADALATDPFRQTGAGVPFLRMQIGIARAMSACGTGEDDGARRQLLQPLRLSITTSSQPYMTKLAALAAIIYARTGMPDRAAQLMGLASVQPYKAIGWMEKWGLMHDTVAGVISEIGQANFDAAWAAGESLNLQAECERVLRDFEVSAESG